MYYKDIEKTFKFCVDDYIHFHDNIKSTEYTDFRINRYGQGGFMKSHIDNIHHSHGQKQGYPHLTSLIFLNDDYEGGQTCVPSEKFCVNPKVGTTVFLDGQKYKHCVKQVKNGTRYTLAIWYTDDINLKII
mgnify:CR=1 FL=1